MAAFDNFIPPFVDANGTPMHAHGWPAPPHAQPVQYINGTPYIHAQAQMPETPGQDMPWTPYPGNGPAQQWGQPAPNMMQQQQAMFASPAQRALPQHAGWLTPGHHDHVIPDENWDTESTTPSMTSASTSNHRLSYYPQTPVLPHAHGNVPNYDCGPRPIFKRPEDWRREFKMPKSNRASLADAGMS